MFIGIRVRIFVLIAITTLLFRFTSEAQNATPFFRHYTNEDGLPSTQIYDVMQDADSYVWFATDRGVARYNGYEFKSFNSKDGLSESRILKLFQGTNNDVWMLSISGNCFIYHNNKITAYKFNSLLKKVIGRAKDLFVDSLENVYVSSPSKGIIKIDKQGKVIHLALPFNNEISNGFLINEFDLDNCFVLQSANQNKEKPFTLFYRNLPLLDSFQLQGTQAGSFNALRLKSKELLFSIGSALYELKNNTIKQLTILPSEIVNLYEDHKNQLWVCTAKGLYLYYMPDNYVLNYHYLPDKGIECIIQDSENSYWIITSGSNGVYYLVNNAIKNLIVDPQLKTPVCLTSDMKATVYAAYLTGTILKLNVDTTIVYFKKPTGEFIGCVFYDTLTNHLFFENDKAGYLKDGKFQAIKTDNKHTFSTCFVKRKNELFSIENGTVIKIVNDSITASTRLNIRINCISKNENNELLLGSDGVYKYDETKGTITSISKLLEGIKVDDIASFKSNLCFATRGKGLIFMMKDSSLKTIDESNGLCSNLIYKLLVSENKIWCASYNGISKIEFTDWEKFNYNITKIRINEGMPSNEIYDFTILNDTIWVASKKGISFFNANTDFINHAPPLVHFVSFYVNNRDTLIEDNYRLSYKYNTLRIGFESPLFNSEARQIYQYTLINAGDSITGTTTDREVEFLFLKPGNYVLQVKAMNNSGIWSAKPSELKFTILPPWWQTWWFRILVVALLIAFGIAFYKNRIRKLKEKFATEKQHASLQLTAMRAQMNPHFIF